MKAIRFNEAGGPEVLHWTDIALHPPQADEVQVDHKAIGLNYIDTYHRSGLYPIDFPSGLGLEAAGVVSAIGANVTDFRIGDRVAYGSGPLGAYAEAANVPADCLLKLSDAISFETAAAMMLQGMTAQYLLKRTYKVQPGDTILIHAASGGVGLLLCQWAKHLGATVIGTVGSDEKAELASAHGCDHPILYREQDFEAYVKELTNGQGLPVVYDSVGAETFMKSIDCLAPLGMMVSYGNASGPPPAIEVGMLAAKGSLFLTRPSLFTYVAKRDDLLQTCADLFNVVENGHVKIEINQTYHISDAAKAHRDLETRKTTGSTIFSL